MNKLLSAVPLTILLTFVWAQAALANSQLEIQSVVNKMMPIAEELLLDHGEFFPFGGAMKGTDEIVTLSGIDGIVEQPAADDVIETLVHSLRIGAENGDYKATAIVSNVTVIPPGKSESTPAIAMHIDHQEGLSLLLIYPYKLNDGELKLGDLFAKAGDKKIFQTAEKAQP